MIVLKKCEASLAVKAQTFKLHKGRESSGSGSLQTILKEKSPKPFGDFGL